MKTKLLLTTLLSFYFYLLSSQVPQGFNYQAIARDGSGNPITGATIKVKLSILTDSTNFFTTGGSPADYIWEEEHINVRTNAFGLFTIVLGDPLATKVQGTSASFSTIPWSQSPLYIGTKIANPATYSIMGSARLWSVPYSMIAGDLEGSVKKLAVVGEDVLSDEALFEVKRKDGETMFAVYNHGVRVFMPLDTISKSRKGGFAIGGFDKTKGTTTFQDYFVVNPDSIRAYIDTNPVKARKGGFAIGGFDKTKAGNEEYLRVTRDSTRIYLNDTGTKARKGGFAIGGFDKTKGSIQDFLTVSTDSIRMFIDDTPVKARKGGFAIGGFDKAKAGNTNFLNVATDASGIINPSQNRILWYPLKNAFLTGKVIVENPDSVGVNSFASGYESKAVGDWSQALGYKAIARGDYSTAIGKNAIANSINSFAFGDSARALQNESYALGRGAVASGYRSFAFGSAGVDSSGVPTDYTKAIGDYSFAMGQGSQVLLKGSIAIGLKNTALASYSVAIGFNNVLNDKNIIGSIAIGYGNLSLNSTATALGYDNQTIGYASTSMGNGNIAVGHWSTAIGYADTARGNYSSAYGRLNSASGDWSVAMGTNSRATASSSTAIGQKTIASGHFSLSVGTSNKSAGDYSGTFGCGNEAAEEGAMAFGNYSIALGEFSTAIGRHSTASEKYSIAIGDYAAANGFGSLSIRGRADGNSAVAINGVAKGDYSFALGGTAQSFGSFVAGTNNIVSGSVSSWVSTDPIFIIGNGQFSPSNALTVLKNGNVGIGIETPGNLLSVKGTRSNTINSTNAIAQIGGGDVYICFGALNGTPNWNSWIQPLRSTDDLPFSLFLCPVGGNVGIGTSAPSYKLQVGNLADGSQARANAWNLLSDARYKTNLARVDGAISMLGYINGYYFNWNTGIDKSRQIGLLAQEVEKVLPEVVSKGEDGILSIDYGKLAPLLVEAIKEQQHQIESYKSQLHSLQEEVDQIKAMLSKEGKK